MSACLQMDGGMGSRLHVVSCYTPTRAARREDKEAFLQKLDNIISSTPAKEKYVILGNFNASVGSRKSVIEQWDGVRGPHGHRAVNDAGRELLSFLSLHQTTVCNTWFQKKAIHKQTWQHPQSKQWSCIDFVVVQQRNRGRCVDVTVRRRASCNTDHHRVCARLRLQRVRHGSRAPVARGKGFDMEKLAVSHN